MHVVSLCAVQVVLKLPLRLLDPTLWLSVPGGLQELSIPTTHLHVLVCT